MAITFSDLHTESCIKSLDQHLSGKSFISGDQLTKDDIKVYAAILEKPDGSFPNASKWYESLASQLATSFPGKAVGVQFGGGGAPAEAAALAKAAAGEDDDDLDLFGDETEEEKKAVEEREAAAAKAKSAKNKESGKYSILMDVKPWDDETDMKNLEEAVRSVEMLGLFWGASKLVAVGYGIKKLQIMLSIVDNLVSVDDLI